MRTSAPLTTPTAALSGTTFSNSPALTTPISTSNGAIIPFEQPPLVPNRDGILVRPGADVPLPPLGTAPQMPGGQELPTPLVPAVRDDSKKREDFPTKHSEILQRLKELGAVHDHTSSSHHIYKLNGYNVVVPNNPELPIGTARGIRKQVEMALTADSKQAPATGPDFDSLTDEELISGREELPDPDDYGTVARTDTAKEPTFKQLLGGEVQPRDATVRDVPVKWATPMVFNGQQLLKIQLESRKYMEALEPWRVSDAGGNGGPLVMFIKFRDAQMWVDNRPAPAALEPPVTPVMPATTETQASAVPAQTQLPPLGSSSAPLLVPSSLSSSSSSSSSTSSSVVAKAPPVLPALGPMQAVIVGKHWAQLVSKPGERPTVLHTMTPVIDWECRGVPWTKDKSGPHYHYSFDVECPAAGFKTTLFSVEPQNFKRIFDGASVRVNGERVQVFDAGRSDKLTLKHKVQKVELIGHKFTEAQMGLTQPEPALAPLPPKCMVKADGRFAALWSPPGTPHTVLSSNVALNPWGDKAMTLHVGDDLYLSALAAPAPLEATQEDIMFDGPDLPDLPLSVPVTVYGKPATWERPSEGLKAEIEDLLKTDSKESKLGPGQKPGPSQLMLVIGADHEFKPLVSRGSCMRLGGEFTVKPGHSIHVFNYQPGILRASVWNMDATPPELSGVLKKIPAKASDIPESHSTLDGRKGVGPNAPNIFLVKPDTRDYCFLNGSRVLVLPHPKAKPDHFVMLKCEFGDMPPTSHPLTLAATERPGFMKLLAGPPEALTQDLEYRMNEINVHDLVKIEGQEGCFFGEPPQFRTGG